MKELLRKNCFTCSKYGHNHESCLTCTTDVTEIIKVFAGESFDKKNLYLNWSNWLPKNLTIKIGD